MLGKWQLLCRSLVRLVELLERAVQLAVDQRRGAIVGLNSWREAAQAAATSAARGRVVLVLLRFRHAKPCRSGAVGCVADPENGLRTWISKCTFGFPAVPVRAATESDPCTCYASPGPPT